jgi:hypothetical protein
MPRPPAGVVVMEMTVDECMRGEKVVGLPRRLESLHLALPASRRTMRVFGAIVQISALSMFCFWKQLALSHAVASQLIGHDHAGHILKAFQQTPEETLCCFGIPPWLNENVEHNALLIHGAPQIVLHSLDPYEYSVEVPFVSRLGPAAAQTAGKGLAELLAPAPDRLIGSDNASFSQQQLDIP